MKEFLVDKITLNDELIKICRDKTLEVTGIDVSRKYLYKVQYVVNAKICFIAALYSLLGDKEFSQHINFIGSYIHLRKNTVYAHKREFISGNKFDKTMYKSIEDIQGLVHIQLFPSSKIIVSIVDLTESKLNEYYNYLITELDKTNKLLQLIKSWKKS